MPLSVRRLVCGSAPPSAHADRNQPGAYQHQAGGLRPRRGPPYTLTCGDPMAPRRSREALTRQPRSQLRPEAHPRVARFETRGGGGAPPNFLIVRTSRAHHFAALVPLSVRRLVCGSTSPSQRPRAHARSSPKSRRSQSAPFSQASNWTENHPARQQAGDATRELGATATSAEGRTFLAVPLREVLRGRVLLDHEGSTGTSHLGGLGCLGTADDAPLS